MVKPKNQNDENVDLSENEDSNSQELTIRENKVVVVKV